MKKKDDEIRRKDEDVKKADEDNKKKDLDLRKTEEDRKKKVYIDSVMLPNHAPLAIAEQYGMLATLHPGRIELGLGRAPGSDQTTMRAMRRDPSSADGFIDDVRELRGYLAGASEVRGVRAIPGAGTAVPLIILGSSLYGAAAAASLPLPRLRVLGSR